MARMREMEVVVRTVLVVEQKMIVTSNTTTKAKKLAQKSRPSLAKKIISEETSYTVYDV